MRPVRFQAPNYRCRVVEKDDPAEKEFFYLMLGKSKEEVTKRLENRGLQMLEEPAEYAFKTWLDRAEKAKKAAIEKHGTSEFKFQQSVWSELKMHLFACAYDKCAYCEASVLHVTAGDVEHFRPKSEITEDPGHPGYYWLAYDTGNLLPACEKCNRGGAKMNQFPVGGKRARGPDDALGDEAALLLDPHDEADDPRMHLRFQTGKEGDVDVCVANPVSPKAKASIDVFRLNRYYLKVERVRETLSAIRDFKMALQNEKYEEFLEDLRENASRPFSAACLDAVIEYWEGVQEKMRRHQARPFSTSKV